MANIKFEAHWVKRWQQQFNAPKGFLLIRPKEIYKKNIGIFLNNLDKNQTKNKKLKDIDISIEYHYKKRTLDQNNLMWALYEIEANEINGGISGDKSQMVTSSELYHNDLLDFAPRIEIKANKSDLSFIKSEYLIEECKKIIESDKYYIIAIVSSSHFNTVQMLKWIDRIFNRLAIHGVACTNPGEIHSYWIRWRQYQNDNKIILHDDIMTADEYRALNPICEATGDYIGNGSGQLCHIQARGMGGNFESRDYSSNWLHMSHNAHIETQHQKGWEHFLKIYPHLKYKVETALKRNYDINNGGKE
jgi:hypothetical protein